MHGIGQMKDDEEEFRLNCLCGFTAKGERSMEPNARNDAYRVYREHLIKETKKGTSQG